MVDRCLPSLLLTNVAPDVWPTREQQLLVAAALLAPERAAAAWAEWRTRVDLDAVDLGTMRLLPLVYHNLRATLAGDPLLEMSKGLYRRTWYSNHLLLRDVVPVLAALRDAGVPTLLLKGAALVVHWYRDHGLRPMGDCDVAVPPRHADVAMTVLERLGWTIDRRRRLPLRENLTHFTHAAPFRNAGDATIDLHWYVVPGCRQRGVDDAFWDSAIDVELHGVATRILAPSDQLLHVLLHGANWDPVVPPFRWCPDAATILRAAGASIDWPRVAAEARKRRRTLVLAETLRRVRELLGDVVPPAVVAELRSSAVGPLERASFETLTRGARARGTALPRRFRGAFRLWRRYNESLCASLYDDELARLGRARRLTGFSRFMLDDLGETRVALLPYVLARKVITKPSVLIGRG